MRHKTERELIVEYILNTVMAELKFRKVVVNKSKEALAVIISLSDVLGDIVEGKHLLKECRDDIRLYEQEEERR